MEIDDWELKLNHLSGNKRIDLRLIEMEPLGKNGSSVSRASGIRPISKPSGKAASIAKPNPP